MFWTTPPPLFINTGTEFRVLHMPVKWHMTHKWALSPPLPILSFCAYVCTWVNVGASLPCVETRRPWVSVFTFHLPLLCNTPGQLAGEPPGFSHPSERWDCRCVTESTQALGNRNPGPQANKARVLPREPSPQPLSPFYFWDRLTKLPRLALKLWFSCLSLLSTWDYKLVHLFYIKHMYKYMYNKKYVTALGKCKYWLNLWE